MEESNKPDGVSRVEQPHVLLEKEELELKIESVLLYAFNNVVNKLTSLASHSDSSLQYDVFVLSVKVVGCFNLMKSSRHSQVTRREFVALVISEPHQELVSLFCFDLLLLAYFCG